MSGHSARATLHRQIRAASLLPTLAVMAAAFLAGVGALRLLAPGQGLPTPDRLNAGFIAVCVAMFLVHEALHLVVLRACGVPWSALRLAPRWFAILIEVSPSPPPRVMRAVALAPAAVLSAALAVLVARTGSSLWLTLFSMHAGGCTWDLVLARRLGRAARLGAGRAAGHDANRAPERAGVASLAPEPGGVARPAVAGTDDRRRARRGLLAIVLLTVAAVVLAGAAPARWIATRTELRPAPIADDGAPGSIAARWVFSEGPARRVRATWRCYRSGELVDEQHAERELSGDGGELVVHLADSGTVSGLSGSLDLGEGHVASMALALPPELLKLRLTSTDKDVRRLQPGDRHSLLTVFGGARAQAAIDGAGADLHELASALNDATFDQYDFLVQAQVEFLR